MNNALITVLGAAIVSLIAYIFLSFRSDTTRNITHLQKLIEQMVETNTQLNKIITDHDYRLKLVEGKLKIKSAT